MIKYSIIIPLFNKSTYIKATLESICSQLNRDTEVVIIDDGSTDDSATIANQFVKKYENIKLFCYDNRGVSVARNRAIRHSEGDYLIFIDADDIMSKGYVDDIRFVIDDLSIDFSILGYNYSRNGKPVIPEHKKDGFINYFKEYLKYGPPFCSSSVVIAKNKLRDLDIFPEGEWLGEDIYAWSKIISSGGRVYFRNYIASDYVTDINGAMSNQKVAIKLIRNDCEISSEDVFFRKFINHHKKDFLKSSLLFGDVEGVRNFLKEEGFLSFIFYRIVSLIPHRLLMLLIKIKRKML